MTGWLVAQLPRAMAQDRVIAGFVRACEEVADSVRERVASVEHELDIGLASPEMLSYLAGWLGVELDVTADGDGADGGDLAARAAQRRLVRAVGQVLGWRGTRRGAEVLLQALTGARVEVTDSGGVFGSRETIPPADDVVHVLLEHTGPLSERQVLAFLAEELPVGARVDLRVGREASDAP